MSNAITEAKTIGQVVEIINRSKAGRASGYFGGTDTREAEEMAGQYAWEAAVDAGYTDDASIEAQLEFLADAGAQFDFSAALEKAVLAKGQANEMQAHKAIMKLQADNRNGVYTVSSFDDEAEILTPEVFYQSLSSNPDERVIGTIIVTDTLADKIRQEYGINK